jgi:hypothetical protein
MQIVNQLTQLHLNKGCAKNSFYKTTKEVIKEKLCFTFIFQVL